MLIYTIIKHGAIFWCTDMCVQTWCTRWPHSGVQTCCSMLFGAIIYWEIWFQIFVVTILHFLSVRYVGEQIRFPTEIQSCTFLFKLHNTAHIPFIKAQRANSCRFQSFVWSPSHSSQICWWREKYCPAKPKGSICLLVKWADTAFWLCKAE